MTANVNFKHSPQMCPRATSLVAMLEAEELDEPSGTCLKIINNPNTNEHQQEKMTNLPVMMADSPPLRTSPLNSSFISDGSTINENKIEAMVFYLSSGIEKMRSPTVWALLTGEKVIVNIDEGSELNCVDADLMHRLHLQIIPTATGAKSAGSFRMKIEGQTKQAVTLEILTPQGNAKIDLGCCLVVKHLGVEVLLGQPAKFNHQIITIPHSGQMTLIDLNGRTYKCPTLDDYSLRSATVPKTILRIEEDIHIYPGDKLTHRLPNVFKSFPQVVITPRKHLEEAGVQGTFAKTPPDGCVNFQNNTKQVWFFKKHTQLADVRAAIPWDKAKVAKLYNMDMRELSNFEPTNVNVTVSDFVKDVSIDPDDILNENDRNKFHDLCHEFKDIIQYNPGTYNGAYGLVKNTVEFTNIAKFR